MMAGGQFWVGRGGSAADIVARDPAGRLSTSLLPSPNSGGHRDAAMAGFRARLRLRLCLGMDRAMPPGAIADRDGRIAPMGGGHPENRAA
ncbi:hypothetical protein BKE38_05405 [Pseudoroseomonas deserti]|uniref:Uncharacterized protein n=2 Tax=Teichococcus deserti TaxID=1817963 RepID=A0A1V2H5P7_9PROT|nr:hypothetical protein BKE38_05405 [Pseudoroseomonas deserti]